jgi:alanine racemase
MIEISFNKLSEVLQGKISLKTNLVISEILTDSRSIVSSTEAVFFALKSSRNDGHKYISDLYHRGIVNFVVSDFKNEFKYLSNANFIIVEHTLKALQQLGKYCREQYKGNVVAIIGSNGKTVVKEWIYQLLHEDFSVIRSPKSYNSQIGVPLSLCLLSNSYEIAFIEAGISMPEEMEILEYMIRPDSVIFTSLGDAHQSQFEDLKHKTREKLMMAKNARKLIYSSDYKEINEVKDGIINEKKTALIRWSLFETDKDIFVETIEKNDHSSEIRVNCNGQKMIYSIPFIDEASVKNSLSCLAFLYSENLIGDKMPEKFKNLETVEMRIEQKMGINQCILINDYYNSDIVSLKIAVDLLKNMSSGLSKTLILSDIMQSGMQEKELYETVAGIIKNGNITRFIGIGESISMQNAVFKDILKSEFYRDTDELLLQDIKAKFKNEVILLKGSGIFEFKRISEILELKKHQTVLEINLEAITHNLNYYKSLVPTSVKKMAMVKALSYGSGTYEIANLLQHNQIDYLGVAFADEGVRLRKEGISSKIMVMNSDENGISDIIDYKLEPEIYSFRILDLFLERLKDYSGVYLPVHIKIDTGMKRLGFCENQIEELIFRLKNTEYVYVQSVFSHLVAADEAVHDDFTKIQIQQFKDISDKMSKRLGYKFIRHILNTSGIERFPGACFEMFRIGIGLYGFSSGNNPNLMNVSTLKTTITQIKGLKKDETVGYGRKWTSPKDTQIGIIPVGYADGLSRNLSNGRGEVIVKGTKVPIIGNVCMDMCMIDIGELDVKEGDEVIIFSDDYPASIMAEKLNTIPYEIISGISERVKRIYKG